MGGGASALLARTLARLGPAALLVLVAVACATALQAGATITGDQPPASGDWVVTHPTTVTDETVTVVGDIIVSSQLGVTSSTIRLAPPSDGAFEVNVTAAGQLDLSGSTVNSSTGRGYGFVVQGGLSAVDSTLARCYRGVQVTGDQAVVLRRTSIVEPFLLALALDGADDVTIDHVSVRMASLARSVAASGDATDAMPSVSIQAAPAGIVTVRGCSPAIDGLDIRVNATVSVSARIEVHTASAAFRLACDFPAVELVDGASLDARGIVVHDSRATFSVTADIWNYVAGAEVTLTCATAFTAIYAHDHGGVELAGCTVADTLGIPSKTFTVATHGQAIGRLARRSNAVNSLLLLSRVDETSSDPGPHTVRLAVRDASMRRARVLACDLVPGYAGTSPPTYVLDVAIDNVSVDLGFGGAIVVRFDPAFAMMKTLRASVRVTNSTFRMTGSAVMTVGYASGPDPGTGSRWFELRDGILFEGCTVFAGTSEPDPAFNIRTSMGQEPLNLYVRDVRFADSTFVNSIGPLLALRGRPPSSGGTQNLTIEGCTFNRSRDRARTIWADIEDWNRVDVLGCTFLNNSVDRGLFIADDGGVPGSETPSNVTISGCTFVANHVIFDGSPARGFVLVGWGGVLEFSRNDVTGGELFGDEMVFLNASERPVGEHGCRLEVHNNTVHSYNGTVVLLSGVGEGHTRLTAEVRDNAIRDLAGTFLDYPRSSPEVAGYDNDSRILFISNSASNCSRTVVSCYGDVEVRGNTFTNCSGVVVRLEQLHLHGPVVAGNIYSRCEDAVLVSSKYWVANDTPASVSDETVDCWSVAYSFYRSDALLTRVTIDPRALTAIVADQSHVDVYNSSLKAGSGEVLWSGHIRVWRDLECWVAWANASGVPSGLPVPHATVSYNDTAGVPARTAYAGADGHVEPVSLMQWSIERSMETTFYRLLSPYNVTATCATCEGSAIVDLTRSLVGADAVRILVLDRYAPALRITSPKDGNLTNQDPLVVEGTSGDRGSGIVSIVLWWDDGNGQVGATLLPGGDFTGGVRVPEGRHDVFARALDAAGNSFRTNISVTVDLTPPALAVTSPQDGLITRSPVVAIVGTYELGADVWVAGRRLGGYTGAFDITYRLVEGVNVVVARAIDRAGNVAEVVLHLTLDTLPPELVVDHPRDGEATNLSTVVVDGRAGGAAGLVVTVVYVGGTNATTSIEPAADWSFSEPVPLKEGWNVITVHAFDLAGNVADAMLNVTLDSVPPYLVVLSPRDGASTRQARVHVIAQVGPDAVSLFVAGRQVPVRTEVDETVDLVEGGNVIVVSAFDAVGNERSVTVNVVLDTVPPFIVVTEPAASPLYTNSSVIRVVGRVEGGSGNVTVGGRLVRLVQGRFNVTLLLTVDGVHTIVVNATDEAGNEARVTLAVDLDRTPAPLQLAYDPPGGRITGGGGALRVTGTTDSTAVRVEIEVSSGGRTLRQAVPLDPKWGFYVELDLARGGSTVVVRVLDRYGNWNASDPHDVVYERADEGGGLPSTGTSALLAVVVIIVVVSALIAWHQLRRRPSGRGSGGR